MNISDMISTGLDPYERKTQETKQVDTWTLIDPFMSPAWLVVNVALAKSISDQTGSSIATISISNLSRETRSIFRAFGITEHLRLRLSMYKQISVRRDFLAALRAIKTKEELLNFELHDYQIGVHVYESILRSGVPTVHLNSDLYRWQLFRAVATLHAIIGMLKRFNVNAILQSHDCYIEYGILCEVAAKEKIKVYFANPNELVRASPTDRIYSRSIYSKDYFESFPSSVRERLISRARKSMEKRLNGEVNVDVRYQLLSSFVETNRNKQLINNEDFNVVIATHCFFDNPHGLGGMLFPDFWEWLMYVGEFSSNQPQISWYIKPHRDFLPGTLQTLHRFLSMFPKVTLIDADTSWHQLCREGLDAVLTCHGTVGQELPLKGIKVLNAGFNPRISFDFNRHALTRADYDKELNNLISSEVKVRERDVYASYATDHFVFRQSNSLGFDYERYLLKVDNNPMCLEGFKVLARNGFIDVTKLLKRIRKYLESDYKYAFELDYGVLPSDLE